MPDYLALKAELDKPAYAGMTDAQARDAIAAAYPSTVPKPFTPADLLGALAAGTNDGGTAQTQGTAS